MAQSTPHVALALICIELIILQNPAQIKSVKIASAPKPIPRHNRKLSFRPKHPGLNSRRYVRPRCRSTALCLQATSEGLFRRLLHPLPLPLGSSTLGPLRCLVFRDRQLFDGLILLLLLLLLPLLILRPDLTRAGRRNRLCCDGRGEASLLFLFFFCFAAFTAKIAVATAEVDLFATVDLVLRCDFAAPMTGSAPASASVYSSASTDEFDS
jgi:hypothetical protein